MLRRAAEGDLEAFAIIYRCYQGVVYRFARAMTGSAEAAEDITQEVFVSLIVDLDRYDPRRASFSSYLYGTVRNLTRQRLRRERRFLSLECLRGDRNEAGTDGDPLHALQGAQRAELVRRALQDLPVRYREIIVLCDLHDMSYGAAADVVGSSVSAVRSRLHRARLLFKARITTATSPQRGSRPDPARCAV